MLRTGRVRKPQVFQHALAVVAKCFLVFLKAFFGLLEDILGHVLSGHPADVPHRFLLDLRLRLLGQPREQLG
ncbi:hypothetical protein D3C78_1910200 [compost metagenome]